MNIKGLIALGLIIGSFGDMDKAHSLQEDSSEARSLQVEITLTDVLSSPFFSPSKDIYRSHSPSPQEIAQVPDLGFSTAEAAFLSENQDRNNVPDLNLEIDPILYSGNYAIAVIVFGETGGVSIAEKDAAGFWTVICGTGGAFSGAYDLQEWCGMSAIDAQKLWLVWAEDNGMSPRIATVYDPPSNVRLTPNGEILCSVQEYTTIMTYREENGWYGTDACGQFGMIHSSQIRF